MPPIQANSIPAFPVFAFLDCAQFAPWERAEWERRPPDPDMADPRAGGAERGSLACTGRQAASGARANAMQARTRPVVTQWAVICAMRVICRLPVLGLAVPRWCGVPAAGRQSVKPVETGVVIRVGISAQAWKRAMNQLASERNASSSATKRGQAGSLSGIR